ncbi:ubiquitin-like small modifier protein 1 [Haladaptatus sp. DJG-WS-42]|uniref:ubiquitin-like small modifier protein 1 n=1 Tax=Haladaptatus sp. DJG-WS-42 TaxID=3120516 RepID=UPI0030D34DC3
MQWKLFANLAEAAGGKEVTVAADPGDTLGDALAALVSEHPALRTEVYDEDGTLHDHIRLLRNGRSPFTESEGLDTVLEAGDELALFPPVSGG